jgi:competence protein ComEC
MFRYAPLIAISVLFLANGFIWYAVFAEERGEHLTVAFLNIGQGDAVFIEAPNGRQMLIDGGPDKSVLRELSDVMPFYDRSIDVVMATHPDLDHIGGLPDVLARYEVDTVFRSGATGDAGAFEALHSEIKDSGAKTVLARRGTIIWLDEERGIYVRILFPDRDVTNFESNDASIIAQLVYGDIEFMLTGDAPQTIEQYLIALEGEALESEVLKVGHHGSRTSTSEFFVGYVSPQYAIISAGADNRYGHPHAEVLATISAFGIEDLGTYEEGRVLFQTDGTTLQRVQ